MKSKSFIRTLVLVILGLVGIGLLTGAYIVTTGVSARPQPSQLEAVTARTVRSLAIRARVGETTNPVPVSDAVFVPASNLAPLVSTFGGAKAGLTFVIFRTMGLGHLLLSCSR